MGDSPVSKVPVSGSAALPTTRKTEAVATSSLLFRVGCVMGVIAAAGLTYAYFVYNKKSKPVTGKHLNAPGQFTDDVGISSRESFERANRKFGPNVITDSQAARERIQDICREVRGSFKVIHPRESPNPQIQFTVSNKNVDQLKNLLNTKSENTINLSEDWQIKRGSSETLVTLNFTEFQNLLGNQGANAQQVMKILGELYATAQSQEQARALADSFEPSVTWFTTTRIATDATTKNAKAAVNNMLTALRIYAETGNLYATFKAQSAQRIQPNTVGKTFEFALTYKHGGFLETIESLSKDSNASRAQTKMVEEGEKIKTFLVSLPLKKLDDPDEPVYV